MMAQSAIAAAAALLTGACSTAQPPADSPPLHGTTPGHKCNPANIQQFVGQKRSAEVEKRMRQVSGAAVVRWAPFGTAVTMEYRFDRLTVFLDAKNRVDRIGCS